MYASSFYPTINTPTRIIANSKTLIDNIFYNGFSKKVVGGYITTSISDHLTNYLIVKDQATNFEGNWEKESPYMQKFNKDSFTEDLGQINWNN